MYTDKEKRLFALHYAYPKPLNRFKKLFEIDPNLLQYQTFSAEKLAFVFEIPTQKGIRLKEKVIQCLSTPFESIYAKNHIIPIPFTSPKYPKELLDLIDPPAVLYCKGNIALLHTENKVAIIGARQATQYSQQLMRLIVPPLVEHQAVIVSGLAKGADTMAHQAAIHFGGETIAVLGHGFSHLYPKENENLAREIAENHLLITEYPPYMKPEKWTFPMRNRIISGLSQVIIITESAKKSGTMITVEHALDHGKDVFAVPGPVTSPLSEGPNKLIGEGAVPLANGYQVIESLKIHS